MPQTFRPHVHGDRLGLALGDDGAFLMNDWSFTQLCAMAGIAKDTINRLSPETACRALQETLPSADKPVQILTGQEVIRSIHGVSYTRLWSDNLLQMVKEAAEGFQPPPKGFNGATGLYAGEQDCFLSKYDINRQLAKKAVELAEGRGKRFTIWSMADALTQLSRDSQYASTRVDADQRASALLALAA